MEFCVPDGDTLLIDLTQFNASINGNTGATVQWFSDVIGMNVISNPASFSGSSSQTLYVNTTDGNCASPIIPIPLNILTDPDANALSINRCGDPSGQITVDLTSLDSLVSGNTGTVIWYSDESLSNVISNPQNLVTGDTILFATVANGFCVSSPVEISISIVDSLIANSLVIELCAVDNDTPAVNLAFYEFAVSGGSGSVNWFTDNIGNDTIPNPSVFNTDGQTLYASISADGCISGIVSIPVEISLSNQPVAACDFTSIDSISISWLGTADDFELSYTINGQNQVGPMLSSMNEFSLGGLGQADTIDLTITALYDSICDPLTSTVTCITDFCPPLPFTFPGLLEDYCRDTVYVPLTANPPGGVFTGIGISNDTLFTYVVLANSTEITYTYTDPISGCVYDTSFRIHITDPWQNFDLHCGDQTFESITFDWDPVAEQYGYSYTINNGPATPLTITTNDTFLLSGLQPGDSAVFTLWSIGVAPCFGDIQNSVWCITKECPVVDLSITNPGILCSDSEPVYLEVIGADILDSPTITWSGDGIIEPGTGLFDPIVAGPEGKLVIVTVEKDGCIYTDSLTLTIFQSPVAAFEIIGSPCVDSTLEIIFNGSAYASGEWDWDFAGADVVQGNTPVDFFVKWDTPGEYLVSLEIDYFGCISNRFETLISIDETHGQITLNRSEERRV